MNPNKALWEKGDFTRLAQSMRRSGESLVNGLGITKGLKVLDLGCGDGTTALPEATLGAEVLGVDIASNALLHGWFDLIHSHGSLGEIPGKSRCFPETLSREPNIVRASGAEG